MADELLGGAVLKRSVVTIGALGRETLNRLNLREGDGIGRRKEEIVKYQK